MKKKVNLTTLSFLKSNVANSKNKKSYKKINKLNDPLSYNKIKNESRKEIIYKNNKIRLIKDKNIENQSIKLNTTTINKINKRFPKIFN